MSGAARLPGRAATHLLPPRPYVRSARRRRSRSRSRSGLRRATADRNSVPETRKRKSARERETDDLGARVIPMAREVNKRGERPRSAELGVARRDSAAAVMQAPGGSRPRPEECACVPRRQPQPRQRWETGGAAEAPAHSSAVYFNAGASSAPSDPGTTSSPALCAGDTSPAARACPVLARQATLSLASSALASVMQLCSRRARAGSRRRAEAVAAELATPACLPPAAHWPPQECPPPQPGPGQAAAASTQSLLALRCGPRHRAARHGTTTTRPLQDRRRYDDRAPPAPCVRVRRTRPRRAAASSALSTGHRPAGSSAWRRAVAPATAEDKIARGTVPVQSRSAAW
ncbi:uncharacterized protein LOC126278318 [Schistocerca gregaria]|uniref:uncharacterized protein LOC126278318 n=1 Tax=Schistocerca gregaria TaxID=7010 RepID=UPI00211E8181|nr:uncharacterized protein LOC126278318 [Schistocerca gregaria]